jgi:hypothetical protein
MHASQVVDGYWTYAALESDAAAFAANATVKDNDDDASVVVERQLRRVAVYAEETRVACARQLLRRGQGLGFRV